MHAKNCGILLSVNLKFQIYITDQASNDSNSDSPYLVFKFYRCPNVSSAGRTRIKIRIHTTIFENERLS